VLFALTGVLLAAGSRAAPLLPGAADDERGGEPMMNANMQATGRFDLDMTLIDSARDPAVVAAWLRRPGADRGCRRGQPPWIKLEDELAYWFPSAR